MYANAFFMIWMVLIVILWEFGKKLDILISQQKQIIDAIKESNGNK